MKGNFNTHSLAELHLPDNLKKKLWREKLVKNIPVMRVISALSEDFIASDREAEIIIGDIIHTQHLIEKYKDNFFSYRHNTVPEEIYYALHTRNYLSYLPQLSENFPLHFFPLKNELEAIDSRPEMISSVKTGRMARFCHYIETLQQLAHFKEGLQSGSICLKTSKDERDLPEEANKRYSVVRHVKDDFKQGFEIIGDIRRLTIDIDYILNHYYDDFAWYINFGAEKKSDVLDADFLFDELKIEDVGRLRRAFGLSYDFFKAQHRHDPYTAFYEFSEKVLSPYNVFRSSLSQMSERTALVALTMPALQIGGLEKNITVAPESLDLLKTAQALCSLTRSSMRMWGSAHAPFIMPDEMLDIKKTLDNTQIRSLPDTAIEAHFQRHRAQAIEVYNLVAEKFELEAYSPG